MTCPARSLDGARSLLRAQDGVTVVEVVVAALVLTIGALAVLGVGDAATRNTFRAEQSQVVVNQLQAELEHIRQLPFREVALTGPPGESDDASSPTSRVSGTQFLVNRNGSEPDWRPLAINGGTTPDGAQIGAGTIDPGPVEFESGDVTGEIYRYVVFPGAPENCAPSGCSEDDLKRAIIAIRLDTTGAGGERVYQEIQSDIANPDTLPTDNPLPPTEGDEADNVDTFWLTDTTCDSAVRQDLIGDHDTHNTRGICEDEEQFGGERGAPDLMFTERPPELATGEEPLSDYSTDLEPQDIGLTLRRSESAGGCLLEPTAVSPAEELLDLPADESSRHHRMHMWLSNPLSSQFYELTEAEARLQLKTKTIGDQAYPGTLCIWVFKRVTALSGHTVDIPAINLDPPLVDDTHFEFSAGAWPTEWIEIAVPMSFIWEDGHITGLDFVEEARLGLAISVESETAEDGLEFMYDHTSFDSRLEVQNEQGLSLVGE